VLAWNLFPAYLHNPAIGKTFPHNSLFASSCSRGVVIAPICSAILTSLIMPRNTEKFNFVHSVAAVL